MSNNDTNTNWRNASPTVWTGRVLSGLFILFMLGASVVPKLFLPEVSGGTMSELGWPTKFNIMLGIVELIILILYCVPRTSVLGAVLLMAYLGGAMATQVRIENPLFSHILFSVYLGLFMWGGLWLRNAILREIFPLQR